MSNVPTVRLSEDTVNFNSENYGKTEVSEKLVTTKELATVLSVDVTTVKRAVQKLGAVLHSVQKNNQGGYLFTEEQATLIKQEIQKHHNLASRQIDNVSTEAEILANFTKAAFDMKQLYESNIAQLQNENEIMLPKAEYYNSFINSKNLIEIGHLGKTTGIGEIKIFKTLVSDGIIKTRYSTDGIKSYDPCFGYEKYFRSIPVPFMNKDKQLNRDKLMLTTEGFAKFNSKYSKIGKLKIKYANGIPAEEIEKMTDSELKAVIDGLR